MTRNDAIKVIVQSLETLSDAFRQLLMEPLPGSPEAAAIGQVHGAEGVDRRAYAAYGKSVLRISEVARILGRTSSQVSAMIGNRVLEEVPGSHPREVFAVSLFKYEQGLRSAEELELQARVRQLRKKGVVQMNQLKPKRQRAVKDAPKKKKRKNDVAAVRRNGQLPVVNDNECNESIN